MIKKGADMICPNTGKACPLTLSDIAKQLGSKGGAKSKRELTSEQASEMAKKRWEAENEHTT